MPDLSEVFWEHAGHEAGVALLNPSFPPCLWAFLDVAGAFLRTGNVRGWPTLGPGEVTEPPECVLEKCKGLGRNAAGFGGRTGPYFFLNPSATGNTSPAVCPGILGGSTCHLQNSVLLPETIPTNNKKNPNPKADLWMVVLLLLWHLLCESLREASSFVDSVPWQWAFLPYICVITHLSPLS